VTTPRPVLAVVHAEGLSSPIVLAETADAAGCDLVWVFDSTGLTSTWSRWPRPTGRREAVKQFIDDEVTMTFT
jgi:hypothetical protein